MKTSFSPIFRPASFFMIRTALLEQEIFYKLGKEEDAERIFKLYEESPIIQEAILIASPSLYASLEQKLYKKDTKRKQQLTSSLFKYLLRMTTRATPFGLFAGVGYGEFSHKTNCTISSQKGLFSKRARPDMQWLQELITNWSDNSEWVFNVKVQTSQLLIKTAGRWNLDYQREQQSDQSCIVSIRSSALTDFILEEAKIPLLYQDLESRVLNKFDSLDSENLRAILWNIFKKGFLLTEWQVCLLTESPLDDLIVKLEAINHLENVRELVLALKNVKYKIERYNKTSLGKGIQDIQEIQNYMSSINKSDTYLQIDCALDPSILCLLNKKVSEEIQQVVDLLWRISPNALGSPHLKEFHQRFVEKYGTRRLVKVLEVLGSASGIGVPSGYKKEELIESTKENTDSRWYTFLTEQFSLCLANKQKEIILTEEHLAKLKDLENVEPCEAPLSLEIYCEILTKSGADLDAGNFTIIFGPNFGSGQAGSTFGRFLDIMPEHCKKNLERFLEDEEKLSPDTEFIEASYLPLQTKSANVAIHSCLRKNALDLACIKDNSTYSNISLDDIFIGATSERLYLYSPSLGKEINITALNMLNFHLAPHAIRLMREISKENCRPLHPFEWGALTQFNYLPRVRYSKVILFPAKWKISQEIEGYELKQTSQDKIIQLLVKWKALWQVPRYVYLTMFDNRLLLDLENPLHLSELAAMLKNQGDVVLVENIGLNESFWVDGPEGRHYTEFVVPLLRDPKYVTPKLNMPPASQIGSLQERLYLPGSEWLFLKLFLPVERENEFLTQILKPFTEYVTNNSLANKWFFVRYREQKDRFHLRVRFHTSSLESLQPLLMVLQGWAKEALIHGYIQDYSLHMYEKEIERYGGTECIEKAENFFCIDTQNALELLEWNQSSISSIPIEAIAALSILDLIRQCNCDETKVKFLLGEDHLPKKLLQGLKSFEKQLQKLAILVFKKEPSQVQDDAIIKLRSIFEKRYSFLKDYIGAIEGRTQSNQDNYIQDSFFIQQSLIHMHCNRVLGIDAIQEQKARRYAIYLFEKLQHPKLNEAPAVI